MKKLASLLLLPLSGFAQEIQVKAVAGSSFTKDITLPHRYKEKNNLFADVQGTLTIRHWQLGVGVMAQNIWLKGTYVPMPATGNYEEHEATIKAASPVVVPYITVGGTYTFSRLSIQPQVRLGYAAGQASKQAELTLTSPASAGYLVGANTQLQYRFHKQFSAVASIGVSYIKLQFTSGGEGDYMTIPAGIGIGMKI